MAIHNDDLFRREMADVTPIQSNDMVVPKRPEKSTLREQLRRNAATDASQPGNPLSLPESVPSLDPHDVVGHKKNGVQEGVFRKLRLGKYEVQSTLDLHRVRLKDAHSLVYEFLTHSYEQGLRTVVISHGKGQFSSRPALLKSYVVHWLDEFDLVLAYHSAPAKGGGAGATQVLLRKNSQARQENRGFFREAGRHTR